MRSWIEYIIGIERSAAGEGTDWHFEAPGLWPPSLLLLFAVATVAFVTIIYLREGRTPRRWKLLLMLLRFGLFAVLLFMLFGTQVALERTGLPHIAVLVDISASMGEVDRWDDEAIEQLIRQKLNGAALETAADNAHRLDLAKAILMEDDGRLLKTLARDYTIDLYYVASGVQRATPKDKGGQALSEAATATDGRPSAAAEIEAVLADLQEQDPIGSHSRLGQGIRQVLGELRGTEPSAVVMLTDGITTEGESLSGVASFSRRLGVPLFLIGLGSEHPRQDIELGELVVDEVVFVDDLVSFEIPIIATGYAGRRVPLRLIDKETGQELKTETLTLGDDGQRQRAKITYRPTDVGELTFEVNVPPQEGEMSDSNNAASRRVTVRKEKIKVLFAENQPRSEYRYLKSLLERDQTIELDVVVQSADRHWEKTDKSALKPNVFPVSREALFKYDVLIFGDLDPDFLSTETLKNIYRFVAEQDGGVIFVAGQYHLPADYGNTPLAALLPVDVDKVIAPGPDIAQPEEFRPQVTAEGSNSPAFQLGETAGDNMGIWANLPGLFWSLQIDKSKQAARALLVHPTRVTDDGRPMPLILEQYVGGGTVLFHGIDETYRWRYLIGDLYFGRYWVQAIRQLSRSKLLGRTHRVELSASRQIYRRGEPVQLRVRFPDRQTGPEADDGVILLIEREELTTRLRLTRDTVIATEFVGTFTPTRDGRYRASLAAPLLDGDPPAVDFTVVAPPGERERVALDRRELEYAASQTGGRFYTLGLADNLISDLPQGRRVPVESLAPLPLWNRWWVIATFLALLLAEWLLRKRLGLL